MPLGGIYMEINPKYADGIVECVCFFGVPQCNHILLTSSSRLLLTTKIH